jgi:uncharacterized protein (TIGR02271 family)
MDNILNDLRGKHVVGSDGQRIGKVADVYESMDGSGGTFATVRTGLFGGASSFFPLAQATAAGDDVAIPYTKDFVHAAPRVEDDAELTSAEEEQLYTYYGVGTQAAAGRPTGAGHDTSGPNTDDAMTRSEERLHVGTEKVEVGRARLRKYVVTEQQQVTVPVTHEEVRIEREPITEGSIGQALDGPAISEEEHEVVLHAERPVVAKETVPVERVRIGTETVTEQQQVTEQVRKEQIDTGGVYPDADRSAAEQAAEQR